MRTVLACLLTALLLPAVAGAEPRLREPAERLAAALECHGELAGATRAPVLLVHGTNVTREENWEWSYGRALTSRGIPWCAPQMPLRATGDLQLHAEYVVHAVRHMAARAGRRIAVVGASQGGMLPRWALRFWPSLRPLVDDLVGLVPSNHGTTASGCRSEPCQPAGHQQTAGSRFLTALNAGDETFAGISYTNVFTRRDTTVVPPESGALTTGAGRIVNVATQDVCAADPFEHITTPTVDPVAWALTADALDHDGPADVARVAALGCLQPPIPGLDPAGGARALMTVTAGEGKVAPVAQEPPLRCYATAEGCPLRLAVRPRRVRTGALVTVRVSVHADGAPLPGALVRLGARSARTGPDGRVRVRYRFGRPALRRVRVSAEGHPSARARIRVAPRRRATAGRG